MSLEMMILGAQGAGMLLSMYGDSQSRKMLRLGADLEQRELGLRMEQEQLASTEQAVQNSEQLRQVMASNRAIMGARGQMPGVGTAQSLMQNDMRAFDADETARKISLSYRQAEIKSRMALTKMNLYSDLGKIGAKQAERGINMLSTNALLLGKKKDDKETKPRGVVKRPNSMGANINMQPTGK